MPDRTSLALDVVSTAASLNHFEILAATLSRIVHRHIEGKSHKSVVFRTLSSFGSV